MTELFMFIALLSLLVVVFMFYNLCKEYGKSKDKNQIELKNNIIHKFFLIIFFGIIAIILEGIAIGIKIYIN